jgi:hypothetical protein
MVEERGGDIMKKKIKDTRAWNPFVGCEFDCVYCEASYKKLVRWNGRCRHCLKCQTYEPHIHPERLDRLPSDRVIFVCSNGDISFCDGAFVEKIVDVMRKDKNRDRVFLLQSKNPACFADILTALPQNVVLMTTLETNRDSQYSAISKAPPPSQRFQDFLRLVWDRKALVMEPILRFDLDVILEWTTSLNPEVIFIGLESKRKCTLEEPTALQVQELHSKLQNLGFRTYDKAVAKYRDVFDDAVRATYTATEDDTLL